MYRELQEYDIWCDYIFICGFMYFVFRYIALLDETSKEKGERYVKGRAAPFRTDQV